MSVSGNAIIAEAEKLGKAARGYELGGTGPTYYDCSGLVQTTLDKLGFTGVPRTSEEQWAWIKQHNATVTKAQLQPGDLVFANFGNEVSPGHVGIYAGGGQVYAAADPAEGILMGSLSSWGNNVVGYGRVPDSTAGTGDASGGSQAGAGGTPSASAADLSAGGVLKGAEGLLHGAATVIDYFFGMFGRGKGWRTVFLIVMGVAVWMSYRNLAAGGTGGWV